MDIIGITGSSKSSSVANTISYFLGVKEVTLEEHISRSFVRKLRDMKEGNEKDYFIIAGPTIFHHKKLFALIDHKFYIADETANDETQKNMPGVTVLESPGKTIYYYRNQILSRLVWRWMYKKMY